MSHIIEACYFSLNLPQEDSAIAKTAPTGTYFMPATSPSRANTSALLLVGSGTSTGEDQHEPGEDVGRKKRLLVTTSL